VVYPSPCWWARINRLKDILQLNFSPLLNQTFFLACDHACTSRALVYAKLILLHEHEKKKKELGKKRLRW
jgi:hypothetical protein